MTTSASLAALLRIKLDLSYDTMQLSSISQKYEATHKKLEKMERYEEKWEQAFEDAQDVDKSINSCGFKKEKGEVFSDKMADEYAHRKVKEYDSDVLTKLTEEDMEYESIKTVLETSITELEAEKQSWQQQVAQRAGDTGLLSQ